MNEFELSPDNSKLGRMERPITPRRVRWMQRRVKVVWGWSTRRMAERLGISRPHLKRIESGTRTPSEMFAVHFKNLEQELFDYSRQQQERSKELVTLVSKFKLPARIEILAEPRRCAGCKKYFIPITPNQKMHNSEQCRRAARRHKARKDNRQ